MLSYFRVRDLILYYKSFFPFQKEFEPEHKQKNSAVSNETCHSCGCVTGEDGCNGVCSNNEDEADGDRDSASPLNNSSTIGTSHARASSQQRMPRTKPTTTSSRGGNYNYRQRSYCQPHDSNQPLVTTEKKMFNEGLSSWLLYL
jgi:hypothetical protein